MGKLTKAELQVLETLARSIGEKSRFYDLDAKNAVISLSHTGLISDVFETLGGAIICRITDAGRAALSNQKTGEA